MTVLGGLVILLVIAIIGAGSPGTFLLGAVPSTVALVVCLLCYRWLDRWEPEPVQLTLMSLIWGGSAAVLFAMALEAVIPASEFTSMAVVAPLVEEFAKASIFILLLTGSRKLELTSLTDHVVYAGICAVGFAWVENLGYFATSSSAGEFIVMALVRTGFGVLGHPLYTTATAVGIWAWKNRGGFWRVILGYLVACLLHGLWNGGPTLLAQVWGGSETAVLLSMVLVYVVILVPVFLTTVKLVALNRRREAEIVRTQLPLMVEAGLLTPSEAHMVADPAWRRAALAGSGQHGRKARQRQSRTITAVTEAALVQYRIAGGDGNPALVQRRDQLSAWLRSRPDKLGQQMLIRS